MPHEIIAERIAVQIKTISQALRERCERAIAEGESINNLAKEVGIPQPVLQRWLTGTQKSLRLSSADRIAVYFRMRLLED